jgi:hypothetical protein
MPNWENYDLSDEDSADALSVESMNRQLQQAGRSNTQRKGKNKAEQRLIAAKQLIGEFGFPGGFSSSVNRKDLKVVDAREIMAGLLEITFASTKSKSENPQTISGELVCQRRVPPDPTSKDEVKKKGKPAVPPTAAAIEELLATCSALLLEAEKGNSRGIKQSKQAACG